MCFNSFFNHPKLQFLQKIYNVYYIDFIIENCGDDETLSNIAKQIGNVTKNLELNRFAGFGIGFGAYLLLNYACENPNKLHHLIIVSTTVKSCGWLEYIGYAKENLILRYRGITDGIIENLLNMYFSSDLLSHDKEIKETYSKYIQNNLNASNLKKFYSLWMRREDISQKLKQLE